MSKIIQLPLPNKSNKETNKSYLKETKLLEVKSELESILSDIEQKMIICQKSL